MRPALRKRLVQVHRWVGLVLGAYLVLLGLTGSLMVWHREIDASLNPQFYGETSAAAVVSSREVVAVMRESFPDAGFCGLDYPRSGVLFNYRVVCPEGDVNLEVFVSSSDAAVLGTRDRDAIGLDRQHIVRTVYLLHADLLLGDTGRTIAGIAAIIFLCSLGMGLALWWPTRRPQWRYAFRMSGTKPKLRLFYELHRVGGAYAGLLLILSALTAVYLAFGDEIDAVARGDEAPQATIAPDPPIADLAALEAFAAQHFPQAERTDAGFLTDEADYAELTLLGPGSPRSVYGTTYLVAEAGLIKHYDWPAQGFAPTVLDLAFPIHNGEIAGLVGRIVLSVVGLTPLLLFWTGVWLWLRKRSRKPVRPSMERARPAVQE